VAEDTVDALCENIKELFSRGETVRGVARHLDGDAGKSEVAVGKCVPLGGHCVRLLVQLSEMFIPRRRFITRFVHLFATLRCL
jgi:hypothetical protein